VAWVTALSIDIRNKSFPVGQSRVRRCILRDVVLAVKAGQFVCILGPSGCGKTTLLNLIAGLDNDFEGRIVLRSASGDREPTIGYVFQRPTLSPWRTVLDNLRLVMRPEHIARKMDLALLEAMRLLDCKDAFPKSLSLGMSRRVALARAFAVEPDLLLMDEPFVSLDESTAEELRNLLIRTWRGKPTTVLFVTHESRFQLAQRMIVLSGSPTTIVVDQPVVMSAEQRADRSRIEAPRGQLLPGLRLPS
jgi:ABC-type nitrate/sulfonate/bicarbonate transport system ATPase subunit